MDLAPLIKLVDNHPALQIVIICSIIMGAGIKLLFGDTRAERLDSASKIRRFWVTRQERAIAKERGVDVTRLEVHETILRSLKEDMEALKQRLDEVQEDNKDLRRELLLQKRYGYDMQTRHGRLMDVAIDAGVHVTDDMMWLTIDEWLEDHTKKERADTQGD